MRWTPTFLGASIALLVVVCFLAAAIHPLAEVLIALASLVALVGGGNWLSDRLGFPVRKATGRVDRSVSRLGDDAAQVPHPGTE